jgi:hypothetical protein
MRRKFMVDGKRLGWAKVGAVACVMVLGMAYGFVSLRVLLARQSGLGPADALREAISREPFGLAVFVLVSMAVALGVYRLAMPRAAGEGVSLEAGREAGARHWRRLRLLATILALPFILLTAGWVAFVMLTGRDLPEHVLVMLGLAACYAVVAMVYWIVKPSPEYLYLLGTGDSSQVDDERERDVKGRAAVGAIGLFVALVLLVGVPYDVLIRGVLPIRSTVEAGAIILLWSLCSWRWNRKL